MLFALLTVYGALTGRVIVGVWTFTASRIAVLTTSNTLAAVLFMVLERPMLDHGIRLSRQWETTRRGAALFSLDVPSPPAVAAPRRTSA